ncbi:hypothetical protein JXJ21_14130 [candidate division KSB1 bacterium]|nr:hypothetical protein [candidate division KSB1 bacterium]
MIKNLPLQGNSEQKLYDWIVPVLQKIFVSCASITSLSAFIHLLLKRFAYLLIFLISK